MSYYRQTCQRIANTIAGLDHAVKDGEIDEKDAVVVRDHLIRARIECDNLARIVRIKDPLGWRIEDAPSKEPEAAPQPDPSPGILSRFWPWPYSGTGT